MNLRHHISNSLRLEKVPSPWPRMFLCMLSVTLPLVVGLLTNHQRSSIYGALLGFVLILNDHFGPLLKRVLHLLTAFAFLTTSFLIGLMVIGKLWALIPLLFLFAFMLGKVKGQGIELERLLLFSIFQMLNAALTPQLKDHALELLFYASLSLGNYLVCLCLVYLVMKHQPNFQRSKREEFLNAISKKESHRYAFTLAVVACIGLVFSSYLEVQRAPWVIGTILIVMMPSKLLSYQRSFQRLFGTLIGVICATILLYLKKDPWILISFSAVAAFMAPLGLIRNYWLGNAFIAALIMFFLEYGAHGMYHESFALLRVIDIAMGCLIGAMGTMIVFLKK